MTTSQYDGLNRLTRLTHAKAGNTLADFQYQLNAVSGITQMIDGAGTHNYTYDTRDRLTAATHPTQTNESYSLDDVGNRTASHQGASYSYQSFNRLVTANSSNFGYNANGNLTSKTDAGGSWTYSWDYENRLTQASRAGGVTVTYSYDALGRRIQRTSSTGVTTKFVYDGSDVLRDLDGTGNTIADYLNGPGIDNKLRQTRGGTALYFIQDHLGTTRVLADGSGNVASSLGYDSYGKVTNGSAATRYTYTGREIDSETGLMYYRARWYDPQAGRFISEDPIGFLGQDVNFYGYVHNDPLRLIDPTGLRRCNPIIGAIVGGLLGAGGGAGAGAVLGAVAGGTIGAAGGTLLIPGILTIAGGGSGVVAGSGAGAFLGGAIGAGVGIGIGWDYCAKECDETDTKPWSPNPPQDDDRVRRCDKQYYEVDTPRCNGITRMHGAEAGAKCHASAAQRYAACLAGLPLPPLDTRNN